MTAFSVTVNKTIADPSGKRFIVKGVTMFDYLFPSYELRSNYLYREIGVDTTKNHSSGVSEPTYYARTSYISHEAVAASIDSAKLLGINLIRVSVDPAMQKASVAYTDPSNGCEYPSDMDMLDAIVSIATEKGVVVQLQQGNDKAPVQVVIAFLSFLAQRYRDNAFVWINPANELNGANGSGNVNNVSVWHATMSQYIAAIRAPNASGGKFLNPIVINPPNFGENLAGIVSTLTAYSVYSADPCLIVGVHLYPLKGEHDFKTARLPSETNYWFRFVNNFCIFIDEVGINNYGTSYDPDLNPGYSSADPAEWERMKSWTLDFCSWLYQQCNYGYLNGATGMMWYAYIPGMAIVDLNSMIKVDGSLGAWGQIFTSFTGLPDVVTPPPIDNAWITYRPVIWAASGAIGPYSASGRVLKLTPRLRMIQLYVNLADNGSGSGALYVTLPTSYGVPVGASQSLSGTQIISDFSLVVRITEGVGWLKLKRYDGAYPGASGAQFVVSGFYEVSQPS